MATSARPPATGLDEQGRFRVQDSQFRQSISQTGPHTPEKGRYILYAGYICPYASRALIVRKLKGLEDAIELALVHHHLGPEQGWEFKPDCASCTTDPVANSRFLSELYHKADPSYSLRFTIPMLWDRKLNTIVNNESSELIRMFNSEFNDLVGQEYASLDLYPQALRGEIDAINEWVYSTINNGVYRAGMADSQAVYDESVTTLFTSLDRVEKLLENKKFLCGPGEGTLTEADVRLFTTVVRFDVAYHGVFKCNFRTIRQGYPNIDRWCRNLYWNYPAFKDTTDFEHIKMGYYGAKRLNPSGVVPKGPIPDILGPLDS